MSSTLEWECMELYLSFSPLFGYATPVILPVVLTRVTSMLGRTVAHCSQADVMRSTLARGSCPIPLLIPLPVIVPATTLWVLNCLLTIQPACKDLSALESQTVHFDSAIMSGSSCELRPWTFVTNHVVFLHVSFGVVDNNKLYSLLEVDCSTAEARWAPATTSHFLSFVLPLTSSLPAPDSDEGVAGSLRLSPIYNGMMYSYPRQVGGGQVF